MEERKDEEFMPYEGCTGAAVMRELRTEPTSFLMGGGGIELKCVMNNQHNLSFDAGLFECLAARRMSFRIRCCDPDPDESVYMHVFFEREPLWYVPEPDYWEIYRALEGPAEGFLGIDNDKVILAWKSRTWLCFVRRDGEEFDVFFGVLGASCKSGAVPDDVYAAVDCITPIGRVSWIDDGAEIGEIFSAAGVVTRADIDHVNESEGASDQ